ncbi:probable phospholipid hydroperoxide glutathione peroxidase [Triticum aestivum]|uniref:probable phospholipid hydroperoxide glutathione peroxidase n=1 Tax=Triticum aestivum TaxID=4565 RepID=UPI0003D45418|nr:probable phospholipid hydroperoxide glutathione peroxidase [Triticum aestivum]
MPVCLAPGDAVPGSSSVRLWLDQFEIHGTYEKYKDQGFEIFAFPCNLFGGPELGIDKEIIQIACTRINAEYMIFLQGFCWRHWRSSKGS